MMSYFFTGMCQTSREPVAKYALAFSSPLPNPRIKHNLQPVPSHLLYIVTIPPPPRQPTFCPLPHNFLRFSHLSQTPPLSSLFPLIHPGL